MREDIQKLTERPNLSKFKLSTEKLYQLFLKVFALTQGRDFEKSSDTLENIKVLVCYFCGDERFHTCSGLSGISRPSLEKGLLILGDYGCGKTAMLKSFERLFLGLSTHTFKGYTANEVVEMYEGCENAFSKGDFWRAMTSGVRYFDDVKTERLASNYGKANLFKDLLEKRYEGRKKTYMSCNYAPGRGKDLQAALEEFGRLYGPRVYDRIFEMFNIIEFKGKSFRR